MKLIYLDEAGNTGLKADPDQPIHMIGSLIVDHDCVRPIELKLNELAARCAALSALSGRPVDSDLVEFHGAEIFGGRGVFKQIKIEDRIDIAEAIIGVCHSHNALFGYTAVDKMKLWGGHPHMRCFQFILERLQDFLEAEGNLGLLVADEHRELEEKIIQDLKFSKENTTAWGYRPTLIKNIIDTVHFVKSNHNRLVQACDVLTYFRLKRLRLNGRHWDAFMAQRSKSPDLRYIDYMAATLSRSDRVTIRLGDQIASKEIYGKLWPT